MHTLIGQTTSSGSWYPDEWVSTLSEELLDPGALGPNQSNQRMKDLEEALKKKPVSRRELCLAMCPCLQARRPRRDDLKRYLQRQEGLSCEGEKEEDEDGGKEKMMLGECRGTTEEPILADEPLFAIGDGVESCDLPPQYMYFFTFPPHQTQKHLLCLDIDETLIHSWIRTDQTRRHEDFFISVKQGEQTHHFSVKVRPGLETFLEGLFELYDLAVFTYAVKDYGDSIVDKIDPCNLIRYRLYRRHCVKYALDGKFTIVKDLTRIGKPLSNILLVDNSESAGLWQQNNFILVPSFYGDPNDRVLFELKDLLEHLHSSSDIYRDIHAFRHEVRED
ncbi:Nuclear LIM interactor-interacting factor 1 [Giardia muris]|uniref:Mitochondrial import inner membrane translocase subunit TIM50 n=1 Tax=Giardia muris TaxID=5742 RepID=A0A4Z1SUZ7_GIAMU|nr:Nuclear LIM interactor-interacting factor 1 [Giardia muris]|eukprot:TNJ27418.1 Nuclear LIM interactor-interacting factor 1 [Giardia muris]